MYLHRFPNSIGPFASRYDLHRDLVRACGPDNRIQFRLETDVMGQNWIFVRTSDHATFPWGQVQTRVEDYTAVQAGMFAWVSVDLNHVKRSSGKDIRLGDTEADYLYAAQRAAESLGMELTQDMTGQWNYGVERVRANVVNHMDRKDHAAIHIRRFVLWGNVVDADKFQAAVTNGIGRGKFMGCGLVQVCELSW
jgi:hypothetical protein